MQMTKQNKFMVIVGGVGAVALIACLAAVNGTFANITATGTVNAASYSVSGGAGVAGQALCSNGTVFSTTCSLEYQTMSINGVPTGQAPLLNFTRGFGTLSTSGGITSVGLNMAGSGDVVATLTAAPGTSTALAAFDGAGNIVPSSHQVETVNITSVCTTSSGSFQSCGNSFTWPQAFADTNYSITCTAGTPTTISGGSGLSAVYFTNKTTTGAEAFIQSGTANAAIALTAAEIDCHGIHN
jgi:hypothetical protein